MSNPSTNKNQPQGQLASMLQSRGGWNDFPSHEINRSSSAPPTQLFMPNNDLDDEFYQQNLPAPNSGFNVWSAPGNGTTVQSPIGDQPTIYAPNPVKPSATRRQPTWSAPSPLRGVASETSSPLRRTLGSTNPQLASGLVRPHSSNHYRDQTEQDDDARMKTLLNAALDSREDVFNGPIPRAASTPPTRLQFANPRFPPAGQDYGNQQQQQQDIAYAMQNMELNTQQPNFPGNRGRSNGGGRFEGPYTTTSAHFPTEPVNVGFSREYETLQRPRGTGVFEQDASYLNRPASAQGRFANSNNRFNAPPGFSSSEPIQEMDPAMAQALQTLISAGNLTTVQIQQIQSQMRLNTNRPANSQNSARDTGYQSHRSTGSSPTRSKDRNHSPTSNSESSPTSRSALLEDFRNSKNKKFELRDIEGSIVEFSGDQHGSRFIQQKLESASAEDKELVFHEILPHVLQLTTDVFGNYVIQKFFEHGSQEQKEILAINMEGRILELSLQMYGCRVVQKAFEYVSAKQQAKLIKELEGNVLKCVKDQNGNHVIQKAVERVSADKIRFIIDAFHGQVFALATHPYGCRVIQRIFEHCSEVETEPLLGELHKYALNLIQDQYGNYVIQHILEKGKPKDKLFVIDKVKGSILNMSKHKFASNVVEKCVSFGSAQDRQEILREVITTKADGTTALYTMMKDQFANYVVQKLLDVATEAQRIELVTKIKPQLPSLKKYTYGKHLISKVEKYIIQYRID